MVLKKLINWARMNTIKRTKIALFLILLLAFTLRLGLVGFINDLETDGYWFSELGRNLYRGNGYSKNYRGRLFYEKQEFPISEGYKPPLLAYLIASSFYLIGETNFATQIPSIIAGVLLPLATFYLAKELYNEKAGLISALIVTINEGMVYRGLIPFDTVPYTLLITLATFFFYKAVKQQSLKDAFLASTFLGLSLLTRYDGILLAIVFTLYYFTKRTLKSLNIKDIKFLIIICLPVILLLLPWLIRNYSVFGNPFYTEVSDSIYYKYLPTEMTVGGIEKPPNILDFWLANPQILILSTLKGAGALLYVLPTNVVNPFTFTFACVGILAIGKNWRKFSLLYAIFLLNFIFFSATEYDNWFLYPMVPIIAIFASIGFLKSKRYVQKMGVNPSDKRIDRILNQIFNQRLPVIIFSILIISSVAKTMFIVQEAIANERFEYFEMSTWINENIDESAVIMTRKPAEFTYLSERKTVLIPYGNLSTTLMIANEYNASYIIIDEREIPNARPDLAYLLDERILQESLELLYAVHEPKKILIYKILLEE